jgi:hypothetical protein
VLRVVQQTGGAAGVPNKNKGAKRPKNSLSNKPNTGNSGGDPERDPSWQMILLT